MERNASEPGAAGAPDGGDAHRDERNRRLARNVAVGLAGRVANALVALATVPLLVGLLGADRYGVYVTITAAMGWIQLGILGIGKGLVNTLVAAHARGDEVEARRYLWSFWAGLTVILAAAGAVAAAIAPHVPWGSVFPATPAIPAGETARTVGIAIVFTLLALGLSPLGYVLSAYQDERKSTVWSVVRGAATLAALGGVLGSRGSMPRVALAVGLATVAANAVAVGWLLWRDKPFLRPRAGDVRMDHLARAVGASASFFALDLAAILAYQTDRLLAIHFAGPQPVAQLELATLAFLFAQSIFGVVLMPMWPALGEAVRRGDHRWAAGALRRLTRGSTAGMAAILAAALAVGPPAILLWTGNAEVVPGRWLLLAVGAYFLVRTYTECHTIVLYSLDRQREIFPAMLANGILVVGLGIVLGRAFGVVGVAASNAIAFAVTQGLLVPRRARRHLARLAGGADGAAPS